MPKQYYAYIPFPPCAGASELETAVGRWQGNIDDVLLKKQRCQTLVENLTACIEKERRKAREDLDKEQIAIWENTIARQNVLLAAGPDNASSKRPILLKHGEADPLAILSGKNPDQYVLHVVGHCAPGSTTLRETQSHATSREALSATALIARMAADKLPKDILNVKLLACFGATPHVGVGSTQQAFSTAFWKELRGYCTNLVKMTAYTEAVLLTSFYKTQDDGSAHKAFARVPMGQVLSSSSIGSAGRLSVVSKKYEARRCGYCVKLVTQRCSVCKKEYCSLECCKLHLPGSPLCREAA